MATSPYPFSFSSAPVYAPTTVFSPPPFGFGLGATAYGHQSCDPFPSSAAYHHPFPFVTTPISTQIDPNRPPAAPPPVHGDPRIFPLSHEPPSPLFNSFPTPVCYPTTFSSNPQTGAALPPPTSTPPGAASSPRPGLEPMRFFLSQPPPARTHSTSTSTPTPPSPPPPAGTPATRPTPQPMLTTPTAQQKISSAVTSTDLSPGLASFGVFGNTAASSAATPAPTTTPSPATQAVGKAAISKNMRSVLRDINRRLDEHEIQSRRSIASLQSELSKLVDMASSLNNSMEKALSKVPSSASSATTTPTPSVGFAPSPGSTTMAASASLTFSAAPVSVAPHVLDEMPTPPSGYENHYDGHQNLIHSPCVQGGSTNLHELTLDEVPQSYGFNNLISQSLFLADGTERRYYAPPEDCPLEMAIPERVFTVYEDESDGCSNESIHVFTGTPEQLTYEEQNENLQAPKCFCQPIFSPERPTVGVFSLINEQKLCNGMCGKSLRPQQVNSQQWNILMTEEGRKEWDPGTLKIRMDIPAVVKWSSSEGLPHAGIVSPNILLSMTITSIPNVLVSLPLFMPWDPGAALPLLSCNNQHHGQALQPSRNATTVVGSSVARPSRCTCLPFCSQNICVYLASLNGMTPYLYWDPGVLVIHSGVTPNITRTTRDAEWSKFSSPTSCELPQSSGVKWSTFHVMSNYLNAIFSVRMMQNAIQCLRCWSSINTSYQSSLAPSYFTNHMLLVLSASYEEVTEHCLADQEQQNYEQALTCFSKPHQVQFVHLTTEFSILISDACTQYDTSNGAKSVLHGTSLVLQRATHSFPENYICYLYCNSVLKTEYCQMRYVWQFSIRQATRLKWDPGVQLSFDSWLDILTLWSEIATPLSCTPIPDLAAWPNQSVGNSASYIWDPGTILLWYKSIEEKEMGRLIPEQWSSWFNAMHYCQIFQKCNEMSYELYWHQDIQFNGIDLWMIHFLPP